MKQDKWTKQLHDKLAEHEMAAPEGLWADIEAALAQQPAEATGLEAHPAQTLSSRTPMIHTSANPSPRPRA